MKCKNCRQEKDTHNDRNPWNDCKQFISSKEETVGVLKCKNCRFPEGSHPIRYNDSKECKQFIPSNHSPQVSSTLEKDKDPEGKDDRCHLQEHSSGSDIPLKSKVNPKAFDPIKYDIPLSDKIKGFGICRNKVNKGYYDEEDVAEAVRKLKEEFKDIPLNFYFNKRIDKIFGVLK